MIMLRAILVAVCLASAALAEVVELGVDNLATSIKSKQWTAIMFYDCYNDEENEKLAEIMKDLDSLLGSPALGFAMLDQRRHSAYRKAYTDEDEPTPFFVRYYKRFPGSAENDFVISHRSFMNINGDLFWQSKIVLMGHDFNVYSEVDMNLNAQTKAQLPILARWIELYASKTPEEMNAIILSPINKQAELASEERDNSFTFERYFEALEDSEDDKEVHQGDRFLLETGSSENSGGPYVYEAIEPDFTDDSEVWLDTLAFIIDRYLNWVEGYETKWGDDRKKREDKQTNFGSLLDEMNRKVRDLLVEIFQPKCELPVGRGNCDVASAKSACGIRKEDGKNNTFLNLKPHFGEMIFGYVEEGTCDVASAAKSTGKFSVQDQKKDAVPNLNAYFDEMVFGYGRTPSSLDVYLREHVIKKLGPDAAARREARKVANATDFAMFVRMREYMKIVEETNSDGDLYLYSLMTLTVEWHNILVEFQGNLTQNYLEYLTEQPIASNNFSKLDIEVLDMENPDDFDLLTNYDEFHKRYTLRGIPVVLDKVNMTNRPYTKEYLIEQCSTADVTDDLTVSNPVGEKSTDGWGGLDEYTLHDNLLNDEREKDNNRDLTLEQFILLTKKIDNIYLHDYSLPDNCDKILYEETLYGEHQKYRIPSIVASFDLFQRVTYSRYARSWPSLFLGKKGSNSKLHVDSGATGFFMYLVSGRKRWIISSPSERPFLYESILKKGMAADVLGIDKSDEVNEFLSERFPLLHRAENTYEVIQEPGQLIYIPPDSPHAVENLEDIVGIALNLGPRDVLTRYLHDRIHLTRRFGDFELALKYLLFEDNADSPMPTKDRLYMTYAEYRDQV